MLSSLTIAREWENGTMEQLLSTPVRPIEMALGKLSAYFVLGLVDMLICLFVGVFIFDVPLKGSFVLLMVSSCVFLFGALACGILISAMNPEPADGLSDGHADVLPAGVSAVRIHLSDREHAADHSGDLAHRSGPVLHQHAEGIFLKGIGVALICGSICCC